jgi:hypothetical protein
LIEYSASDAPPWSGFLTLKRDAPPPLASDPRSSPRQLDYTYTTTVPPSVCTSLLACSQASAPPLTLALHIYIAFSVNPASTNAAGQPSPPPTSSTLGATCLHLYLPSHCDGYVHGGRAATLRRPCLPPPPRDLSQQPACNPKLPLPPQPRGGVPCSPLALPFWKSEALAIALINMMVIPPPPRSLLQLACLPACTVARLPALHLVGVRRASCSATAHASFRRRGIAGRWLLLEGSHDWFGQGLFRNRRTACALHFRSTNLPSSGVLYLTFVLGVLCIRCKVVHHTTLYSAPSSGDLPTLTPPNNIPSERATFGVALYGACRGRQHTAGRRCTHTHRGGTQGRRLTFCSRARRCHAAGQKAQSNQRGRCATHQARIKRASIEPRGTAGFCFEPGLLVTRPLP